MVLSEGRVLRPMLSWEVRLGLRVQDDIHALLLLSVMSLEQPPPPVLNVRNRTKALRDEETRQYTKSCAHPRLSLYLSR